MLRAVECHMLEEVSQTALVVVLLDRAHALSDVEVGLVLRPVVVTDVISKSVVQFSDAHLVVLRDRRQLLCHQCCGAHNQKRSSNKESFQFHTILIEMIN